jgi:hypothetical protein
MEIECSDTSDLDGNPIENFGRESQCLNNDVVLACWYMWKDEGSLPVASGSKKKAAAIIFNPDGGSGNGCSRRINGGATNHAINRGLGLQMSRENQDEQKVAKDFTDKLYDARPMPNAIEHVFSIKGLSVAAYDQVSGRA